MSVEGRVVVVSGGAQGIGRAIALKFFKEGANVVVGDMNQDAGKALVEESLQSGQSGGEKKNTARIVFHPYDASSKSDNEGYYRFNQKHLSP